MYEHNLKNSKSKKCKSSYHLVCLCWWKSGEVSQLKTWFKKWKNNQKNIKWLHSARLCLWKPLRFQLNLKRCYLLFSTVHRACTPTSDWVFTNTFSLAATVQISAKTWCKYHLFKPIWGLGELGQQCSSRDMDNFKTFSHVSGVKMFGGKLFINLCCSI